MSNVIKESHRHFDMEYGMSHVIKNNHRHFDMAYGMSHVIKNNHRHFDMEYGMSHVINNKHRHFDMEYGTKIYYRFHVSFVIANVSYENKNGGKELKYNKTCENLEN